MFSTFYNNINLFLIKCKNKNLNFIRGVDFDSVGNRSVDETKYLAIFDDSCKKFSNSKQFVEFATI